MLIIDENHPEVEKLLKRGAFIRGHNLLLKKDVLLIKQLQKPL